jgi:hypothetical protein
MSNASWKYWLLLCPHIMPFGNDSRESHPIIWRCWRVYGNPALSGKDTTSGILWITNSLSDVRLYFWEILLQHYRQVHSSHPGISAIIRISRVELVSADASFTSSKPLRSSVEVLKVSPMMVMMWLQDNQESLAYHFSERRISYPWRKYRTNIWCNRKLFETAMSRNESRAYSSSLSIHESSKWDLKHNATLQQVASLGDVKVPSILLFQVHCFLSLSLHLGINVFLLISLISFSMFSTRKLALNFQ